MNFFQGIKQPRRYVLFPVFQLIAENYLEGMIDWPVAAGIAGGIVAVPVVFVLAVRLYIKLTMGRCRSQNRLDGKVVVITGSNSGDHA